MDADLSRTGPGRATERDYDRDPDRYRAGMAAAARFGTAGADLYRSIVDLLDETPGERRVMRVLDLGCGDGALAAAATGRLQTVGVDASRTMLRGARRHAPAVQADITRLPFTRGCVDAVVAVNVLDHLERPVSALHEARRVLRPGGRLVAGAISRTDSPELAPQWRPAPTPFDSEDAPEAVRDAGFTNVLVLPWDAALVTLPDRDALAAYLRARFVPPRRASELAAAVVARTGLPLPVTKRGALIVARSPRRRGAEGTSCPSAWCRHCTPEVNASRAAASRSTLCCAGGLVTGGLPGDQVGDGRAAGHRGGRVVRPARHGVLRGVSFMVAVPSRWFGRRRL